MLIGMYIYVVCEIWSMSSVWNMFDSWLYVLTKLPCLDSCAVDCLYIVLENYFMIIPCFQPKQSDVLMWEFQ